MNLTIVTAPAAEPVTYGELTDYMRIQSVDENVDASIVEMLTLMIKSARAQIESYTHRALITQTWDFSINDWPAEDYLVIPFGNLSSVTSVKWKDDDATETTLTVTTDYLVETNGESLGRIVLPYEESWPTGTLYPSNPITVRFICGYGASGSYVPSELRLAILDTASWMWFHRTETYAMSQAVMRLIAPYRIFTEFE